MGLEFGYWEIIKLALSAAAKAWEEAQKAKAAGEKVQADEIYRRMAARFSAATTDPGLPPEVRDGPA